MAKKHDKGAAAEEILRNYFLKLGYYVIRGVPFAYRGFSITDIDLWMYSRSSSVSREITIVDVKNKRTPQAIERIFWVKGLQKAINADRAIVATTDKRNEVISFGKEQDILVLNGDFLSRLLSSKNICQDRLLDASLYEKINGYTLGKLDGDWKGKLLESKSLLATGLNFDNCNKLVENARFYAEHILTKPPQFEIACRCFYLICSFIALNVDYLLRDLSFLEVNERKNSLTEGFTFGNRGTVGMNKLINLSLALVEQYSEGQFTATNKVRVNIQSKISNLPTAILGEFFSKLEVMRTLFNVAIELESLAMAATFKQHKKASVEVRSLIGCLLDFWEIDRTQFAEIT
jgi:hypothetical protein